MSAKVLFWDIETAPILAYVWGTFEQNVSLDQIHTDWHVLAWAAKWKGSKEVMYMDQRNAKDITNDKKILEGLWKLLDEADVVVTQNGIQFDAKKVNARFIEHGMKPPSPYKHVDTLRLAKKQFGFTSNKLAYMTNKLCEKYKKLDHGKFPGFSLWQECLKGNKKAWKEMETYNKHDVLALEELYGKLAPWGAGYDPNVYTETFDVTCVCGSNQFYKDGFKYTNVGKYQQYTCKNCGSYACSRKNSLPPEKIKSLKELQITRLENRRGYSIPQEMRNCTDCGAVGSCHVQNHAKQKNGTRIFLVCKVCRHSQKGPLLPLSRVEEEAIKRKQSLREKRRKETFKDCRFCREKHSCFKAGTAKRSDGTRVQLYRCNKCWKRVTDVGAFKVRRG